jgi:hypothetical protein
MWILHYGHLDLQSGHVDFEQWLGQDNPRRPLHLCIVWGLKRAEKAIKYVLAAVCTESKLYLSSSHCPWVKGMDYYIHLNYESQDSLEKWLWEFCHFRGSQNSELQMYLLAIMVGFEVTLLHVGCC